LRRFSPKAVVAVIAVSAGVAAVEAAPAAAAGECPTGRGFPRAHSNWIGRVIETGLSPSGECGAAYTGGARKRGDTSCQPHGQIRLAIWGTWMVIRGDYITVRAYVETKRGTRWLGATTTGLRWSADTRSGKADSQLATSRLTNFRNNPIPGWYQFYAGHTWTVSGPAAKLDGELVRVHVVIRWKNAARGIRDPSRATFDERIGHYCFAQAGGGFGGVFA
jgi:hypothetical protein